MRRILLAVGAAFVLGAPAQAATVTDAVGDFLPSYAGAKDADLDVVSFNVTFDDVADVFHLTAAMAGDIDPMKAGFYVIGINTGTGVAKPFASIGAPNVIFNQAFVVQKSGAAFIGDPTKTLTTSVLGNMFTVAVPLAFLPSTGFAARQYGFNLWPEEAFGALNLISDFSPNDRMLSAAVPEPATWAMMIAGFGLAGASLRRRRLHALAVAEVAVRNTTSC